MPKEFFSLNRKRFELCVLSQNMLTFFQINNCYFFTFASIEAMRFFRHERLE